MGCYFNPKLQRSEQPKPELMLQSCLLLPSRCSAACFGLTRINDGLKKGKERAQTSNAPLYSQTSCDRCNRNSTAYIGQAKNEAELSLKGCYSPWRKMSLISFILQFYSNLESTHLQSRLCSAHYIRRLAATTLASNKYIT